MDEGTSELSRSNSIVMDNSTAHMFDVAMNRVRSQSFMRR